MDNTFIDLYGIVEYFLGSSVGDNVQDFAHAVGEVQKHEHHFKTPEGMVEPSSQGGNKPYLSIVEREFGMKRVPMDEAAKAIAEAGKAWAERVLRREDVLVYVYRLLLEYARVVDAGRERMGWVGDLV